MIDVSEEFLEIIRKILLKHVPEYDVWAFGSRIKGTSTKSSDLDMVIVGNKKINWKVFSDILTDFEESVIPFRIAVLDWNDIPDYFRENILKNYEIIQKAVPTVNVE